MIITFRSKDGGGPYTMPDYIRDGLQAWEDHGHCGSFIEACLSNDFMAAACRADDESGQCLPSIARYIYNEMVGNCWGSAAKVASWRESKEQKRIGREVG